MHKNKAKLRKVYGIFSTILILLFIMITFPPIVQMFDRNDVWVGAFPLSQFFIFMVPFSAAIVMAIMYYFDKKYENEEKKEEGGNTK